MGQLTLLLCKCQTYCSAFFWGTSVLTKGGPVEWATQNLLTTAKALCYAEVLHLQWEIIKGTTRATTVTGYKSSLDWRSVRAPRVVSDGGRSYRSADCDTNHSLIISKVAQIHSRLHYSKQRGPLDNNTARTGDTFISSLHHSSAVSYRRCICRGKMEISDFKHSQVCDRIIRKERIEKRGLVRCKLSSDGTFNSRKDKP